MIPQLPEIPAPVWLTELSPTTMTNGRFPLRELLRDSLYYPCSGFDGDPVKHLAGNILSFVYVDYGPTPEDLRAELEKPGFNGYNPLSRPRRVEPQELTPRGPHWREPTFCIWSVFQRQEGYNAAYGPNRFSLLYIGGEAVETFQALYISDWMAPKAVAVIQPGNPTRFENPDGEFAVSVLQNPAGQPEVLLYGGWQECEHYQKPCWPDYGIKLHHYQRNPAWGGCVRVWARTLDDGRAG